MTPHDVLSSIHQYIYGQNMCLKDEPSFEFRSAVKSSNLRNACWGTQDCLVHDTVWPSDDVSFAPTLTSPSTLDKSHAVRMPPKFLKSAKPNSERRAREVMPASVQMRPVEPHCERNSMDHDTMATNRRCNVRSCSWHPWHRNQYGPMHEHPARDDNISMSI
jgi:hypothetical protein